MILHAPKEVEPHYSQREETLSSLLRISRNMETKDRVSVWAGIITLAVLQVEDRVNTELNIYLSDWIGVVGAIIGYGIGFVIVYFITKILLERYFKGRAQPQPTAIPSFGSP